MLATNVGRGRWDTTFADDKLAAAFVDRIFHHDRLMEFDGTRPSTREVDHARQVEKLAARP